MRLDNMEITSCTPSRTRNERTFARRYVRSGNRGRAKTRAGGMLVKIGFCVVVLATAVFVQNFVLEDDRTRTIVEASTEVREQESDESEDVLGRLRFVETGGTKSVFATSQRWNMPIDGISTSLYEEDTLLEIVGKTGDTVSVSAAGEVRAISSDAKLGDYVRVHHGNDLESVYYNVDDICVEIGQPLLARDSLGVIGDSGMLYVTIVQSGEPQLPAAYLDVRN